jgi:hypothetical protein
VKKWFVAALIALGPTLVAQTPVPEIPFEGNISPLKLPPDMNFGEVSGGRGEFEGRRRDLHAQ